MLTVWGLDMVFVCMLLGGFAISAVNSWQRLGRTSAARHWARGTHRDFAQRNVLVLWPALALALVGGALIGAAEVGWTPVWPGMLLLGVGLLTWCAYAVLPLPVPSVIQPRWYREQVAAEDRDPRG